MFIKRVIIKNFRNLKHIDVNLDPGGTCVVGENNSGKSNFISALRLALDSNVPFHNRNLKETDFSSTIDITTPQQILIGLTISDFNSEKSPSKIKEEAFAQGLTVSDELAQICFRFRPKEQVRQRIVDDGEDTPPLTIADYDWELVGGDAIDEEGQVVELENANWNDNFSKEVSIKTLKAFKIALLPAIRDVESDLRNRSISPLQKLISTTEIEDAEKENLVKQLEDVNNNLSGSSQIKSLGSEIEKSLEETVGSVFKLGISIGLAPPTFEGLSNSLRELFQDSANSSVEVFRNGLGLNNALYISMLLRFFEIRTLEDDTAGQLLLVEEPEAHLHPQLQRIVFTRLLDKKCQVVATSHSTHISSRGNFENLLVFTRDLEGFTSCSKPSTIENLEPSEIKDLERYLDATKSSLLFAKKVLLVEGMSEVFLIPPLVKKICGIDLEEHGIAVIPIHGTHFDSYMKLFGDSGLKKKCAVVTDGDLKPSDANIDLEEEDFELEEPEESQSVEESDEDTDTESKNNSGLVRVEDLKKLENKWVKVFSCDTTFELELASPSNLSIFAKAAKDIGATRHAKFIQNAIDTQEEVEQARDKVLKVAKQRGKARFAQICSRKVEEDGNEIPTYIKDAIDWLTL